MRRSASPSCSTPRCCATIPSTIIRSSIPPPPPSPPRISPASSPPADTGRLCLSSAGSTGPGGKPGACQDPALPPSLGGKFGDFTLIEPILGGAAAPADAANLVKNGSTQTFMADVIDASHDAAVVVDFWAPWCGPCKQLGPMLEKAVRDARGAVRMVKINIDENPELAQQMRIQSIPAVYAFKDGRPVDGFVGALPESQVKQFIGKLAAAGGGGASPVAEALALAKESMAAGDTARAANIFAQVVQHEPGNVDALAGLARIALAKQDLKQARAMLEKIPAEHASHAEVAAARAGLELAEAGAQAAGAVGELKTRLERNAA